MRLIDADKVKAKMESTFDMQDLYLPIHFQEMVIDEMPTVDAVEVVRCKDCKCYDNKTMECCGRSGVFYADDYCSRGRER